MLAVNKIAPAAPQPLAQIHDKVQTAWQAQERAARLTKLGEDYAAAVNKGEKLDDLAALHGLKTFTTKPLSRYGANAELPPVVVSKLFSVKPGQAVSGGAGDKGTVVATVNQVLPPDPAEAASQKAAIAREIETTTRADLLDEYEQALRHRFPVDINADAVKQLM